VIAVEGVEEEASTWAPVSNEGRLFDFLKNLDVEIHLHVSGPDLLGQNWFALKDGFHGEESFVVEGKPCSHNLILNF